MNPPCFVRFSQPHFLKHIGRERVTQILLPFAPELLPHGIALPATALPDDLFFQVLATLAQRASKFSMGLLDAMTAIEVIEEVFPDERGPLVVTELRFRLRSSARPILLSPSGLHGALECEVAWAQSKAESGNLKAEIEPSFSEDVARQAFALLQKLELDAPLKAPSVLTVFRLYCVDGYSADRVARKCRCSKGTVMSRLRFIEKATKTKPEKFRAVSSHLQQMDDEYNASGAREIYRQGLGGSATGPWSETD